MPSAAASARVFAYSHDTYGLGHLRRSTSIAERFVRDADGRSVLVATGSPRAQGFSPVKGVDYLKLPSVLKRADGTYAPRTLRGTVEEIAALRGEILRAAVLAFRPDALLVDHAPVGFARELEPTFAAISALAKRPKVVLGLREIVDDVEAVRVQWAKEGVWKLLDGFFDKVLVYGDPAVRTTADELGLPARLGDRLVFTGYVGRDLPPAEVSAGTPTILVSAGGGGDGAPLFRAFAAYLAECGAAAPFRTVVVTGPFLSADRAQDLRRRFADTGAPCEIVEFTEDFGALLANAKALVSMAGYNTTVEALAAGVPTLLVPRTAPRREQEIRAERIAAAAPHFRAVAIERLTPGALGRFVDEALASAAPTPSRLRLDGADVAAREIAKLLSRRSGAAGGGAR
jgi:predicted glycosyltransferase